MSSNYATNVSYQTSLRLNSIKGLQDKLTSTSNTSANLWKKSYLLGPSYVLFETFVENTTASTSFSYGSTYKFELPPSIDFALNTYLYLFIGRSFNTSTDTYYTTSTGTTTTAFTSGVASYSSNAMNNLGAADATVQFQNNDDEDTEDRDISFIRCVEDFGHSFWTTCSFTVSGSTTIQTIHSLFEHIQHSLDSDPNRQHPALTGRTGDARGVALSLSKVPHFNQLFFVNLGFFWADEEEMLPLIALYLTTPRIEINTRSLNQLVFASDYAVPGTNVHSTWTIDNVLNSTNKSIMPIKDMRILVRHLLVSQEYRERWGKKNFTYFYDSLGLIETNFTAGTSPDFQTIDLSSQHNMCSELILVFISDANAAAGHYYDFSGNENSDPAAVYDQPGVSNNEAFASLQMMLGTQKLNTEMPATYYRILLPSICHQQVPSEMIYTIPFYIGEQRDRSNAQGAQKVVVRNSHNLSRMSNFKLHLHKATGQSWANGVMYCFQRLKNVINLANGTCTKRWGSANNY